MKARIFRMVVIWALVFAGAFAYFYNQRSQTLDGGVIAISPDDVTAGSVVQRPSRKIETAESDIGGSFALIDQNGQAVTEQNYANAYKLVFFGFTYCPAVCPTELQKVALILDDLAEDGDVITPIFVSVDPERDTPEQMKQYVEQFHPRLVGLTGSFEQIEAVKQSFRVYATKTENEFMDEYMVDHSAFLYLMDQENKMIALYPSTDTAEQIAQDIKSRNLTL